MSPGNNPQKPASPRRAPKDYLGESPPRPRRETSDERRARQTADVAGQQAQLKREAAERRKS